MKKKKKKKAEHQKPPGVEICRFCVAALMLADRDDVC